MDFNDENSPQAISQTYKIWKNNTPFLYNTLQVFQLPSCSQTIDWLPESYINDTWEFNKLVIGSNSFTKNYIMIIDVALPTDQTLVDYTSYRQSGPPNPNVCTLGQRTLNTFRSFPQTGEIMRVRASKISKGTFLAANIGGENFEYFVYDANLSPDLVEKNKINLVEHQSQGFGLDWHPLKQNILSTGSFDKKLCIWDISAKSSNNIKPIRVFEHNSAVENVKWFKKDENLIASGTQDKCINIWDIRQTSRKPSITKIAHNGEVYSVDLNKFSEYLLLSGGQDTDINLWDTRNMSKHLHQFFGHSDAVTKVEWSNINPYSFSSSSFDRRVVTWNMKKIDKSEPQKQIQFIHGGHRSPVLDINWNEKGRVCASTQQHNILHVWEMNDKCREQ